MNTFGTHLQQIRDWDCEFDRIFLFLCFFLHPYSSHKKFWSAWFQKFCSKRDRSVSILRCCIRLTKTHQIFKIRENFKKGRSGIKVWFWEIALMRSIYFWRQFSILMLLQEITRFVLSRCVFVRRTHHLGWKLNNRFLNKISGIMMTKSFYENCCDAKNIQNNKNIQLNSQSQSLICCKFVPKVFISQLQKTSLFLKIEILTFFALKWRKQQFCSPKFFGSKFIVFALLRKNFNWKSSLESKVISKKFGYVSNCRYCSSKLWVKSLKWNWTNFPVFPVPDMIAAMEWCDNEACESIADEVKPRSLRIREWKWEVMDFDWTKNVYYFYQKYVSIIFSKF